MEKCIKSILNTRFNKNLENIFLELEGINPKASGLAQTELTQYPVEWFHNRKVFIEMKSSFETILLDETETLQHKFRASLALIFLHDGNRNFPGCKKFYASEKNKVGLACARLVYNSDCFNQSFKEVETNLLPYLKFDKNID